MIKDIYGNELEEGIDNKPHWKREDAMEEII